MGHFGDVLTNQSLGLLKNWSKHNKSKYASVTKYATTKLTQKTKARFSRLLRHPDWKRRGPIMVLALHKFVTYLLWHLPTYLQTRDPYGAGIGEAMHIKFRVLIHAYEYSCMHDTLAPKGLCSQSYDLFKFREISGNISLMAQDRDIVATEH